MNLSFLGARFALRFTIWYEDSQSLNQMLKRSQIAQFSLSLISIGLSCFLTSAKSAKAGPCSVRLLQVERIENTRAIEAFLHLASEEILLGRTYSSTRKFYSKPEATLRDATGTGILASLPGIGSTFAPIIDVRIIRPFFDLWFANIYRNPRTIDLSEFCQSLGVSEDTGRLLEVYLGEYTAETGELTTEGLDLHTGLGNSVYSRVRAEVIRKKNLRTFLLLESYIPRFSAQELGQSKEPECANFRARYHNIYGKEATEFGLYSLAQLIGFRITHRWKSPLTQTDRFKFLKRVADLSSGGAKDRVSALLIGNEVSLYSLAIALYEMETPLKEMSSFLSVSELSIRKILLYTGVQSIWDPEWTEAELAFLDSSYGNLPLQVIAETIGRSNQAVYRRAILLGLHLPEAKTLRTRFVETPDGKKIEIRDEKGFLLISGIKDFLISYLGHSVNDLELARLAEIDTESLQRWRHLVGVYLPNSVPIRRAVRMVRTAKTVKPENWKTLSDRQLADWRNEMQDIVVRRSVQHFFDTGETLIASNAERITGFSWDQISGTSNLCASEPLHAFRFFDSGIQFYFAYNKNIMSSLNMPEDFSPFAAGKRIRGSTKEAAEFSAHFLPFERRRLIKRALQLIVEMPTQPSRAQFLEAFKMSRTTAFENNQTSGSTGLASRFPSYLYFLEELEKARITELKLLREANVLGAVLARLEEFTVWAANPASEQLEQMTRLYDRDRALIQQWVLEELKLLEGDSGKTPTIKTLAARLLQSRSRWNKTLSESVQSLQHQLVGTGFYAPSRCASWIFRSREELLQRYVEYRSQLSQGL